MSFLKKALKSIKNEYASIVEDGLSTDNTGFIDTGSYVVNALVSGSIYGGYPQNRVTAVAGESSVGKTYFAMTTVKTFLDNDPSAEVVYFDSESAFTKEMFVERGMDTNRIAMVPVATLDEFKFQALKILEQYNEIPKEERPPLLMVLDSLGNLSSEKELNDASEGKSVQDMTRGRSIRSIFRVLTLKLGKLNVPMIVTNHVFATMDQYNPSAMGGTGLKYAASTILFLSKRKERDAERNVIGNVIHVKAEKSRMTREQMKVDTRLFFDSGLDRYYGLVDLAIGSGIWKKVSTRVETEDGKKVFQSVIERNPEQFFNETVLNSIDEYCKKKFCFGKREDMEEELDEEYLEEAGDE